MPLHAFFLITISAVISIWSLTVSALYAGDLVLTGNDVMTIENTTYTQTGNIYIRDNAKLTIRNSRLIVNISYHDQYKLEMTGKASLEIINSTLAAGIPNENIQFNIFDETTLIVQDSDLREGAAVFTFGANAGALFKGNSAFTNSKVGQIHLFFTPLGSQKVSVSNSESNEFTLRFRGSFQGEFSNLKPGLLTTWVYQENGHDITIQNTTIYNITVAADGPSQVVIRNSEIFSFGPTTPDPSIILRVVDSKIHNIPLHGLSGITATFNGLKPGIFSNWKLSDHSTGGPLPEIILENSQIIHAWQVSAFGSNLSINDSDLYLRAYWGVNNLNVTNSTVRDLMLYQSTNDIITFDNSSIDFLDVYVPPNSTAIRGNITFIQPQVKRWFGPSNIKRTFPVSIIGDFRDTKPTAYLSLQDKTGTLIWSGQTDSQGKASFDIDFNDANYTDIWSLTIQFIGRTTTESITLLTSTPIKIARTIPVIQVLPLILNYGYILEGSTKDLNVTVTNIGGGTLIGNATTMLPFSIISGGSYSLGADQSQGITIQYKPTFQGTHTGTVVFSGADGITVQVAGTSTCSGDKVELQNTIFISGKTYNCTATTSITAGTGVTVQSGATVNFRAPKINLQPGFKVESGAVFSAKQ